jgi:hypothetical protein
VSCVPRAGPSPARGKRPVSEPPGLAHASEGGRRMRCESESRRTRDVSESDVERGIARVGVSRTRGTDTVSAAGSLTRSTLGVIGGTGVGGDGVGAGASGGTAARTGATRGSTRRR